MTVEQKKLINEYVAFIQFKFETNLDLEEKENEILNKFRNLKTLEKLNKKNNSVDLEYLIFTGKYELAILVVDYYNLETKNPIERLEERRLKNFKEQKIA